MSYNGIEYAVVDHKGEIVYRDETAIGAFNWAEANLLDDRYTLKPIGKDEGEWCVLDWKGEVVYHGSSHNDAKLWFKRNAGLGHRYTLEELPVAVAKRDLSEKVIDAMSDALENQKPVELPDFDETEEELAAEAAAWRECREPCRFDQLEVEPTNGWAVNNNTAFGKNAICPPDATHKRNNVDTPIFYKVTPKSIKRYIKYNDSWVNANIGNWAEFCAENNVQEISKLIFLGEESGEPLTKDQIDFIGTRTNQFDDASCIHQEIRDKIDSMSYYPKQIENTKENFAFSDGSRFYGVKDCPHPLFERGLCVDGKQQCFHCGEWVESGKLLDAPVQAKARQAHNIAEAALQHVKDRASTYDQNNGERSAGKTATAFNAITGKDLTESDVWLLLQLLKDVRQWSKIDYHQDSAEDCIAYAALKAESLERGC